MKTIKRITFGLVSSLLLAVGLSQTAARMDPVTQSLESLREKGGELAGPALPCARATGELLAGPALPCARSTGELLAGPALPCARSTGQTSSYASHC